MRLDFGPSSALLATLVPVLLYMALLWLLLFTLFKLADRLLVAQSRMGIPSNADNAWAVKAYDYSRLALLTHTICVGVVLALGSVVLRLV
jgi:hypothetical protein